MVEHGLGEGRGCCLDAQVPEHGVRFPAAKEHDGICAGVGTEEGGGSARPKRAGREERGGDAGLVFEGGSGVAESVGDEGAFGVVPASGYGVEVPVNRVGWLGARSAQAQGDASECLRRAQVWVLVWSVSYLFASHSVLLVSEL